jgi:hypothetical protein
MGLNLEKETRIDEKYNLEHIHDTNTYRHYPYENNLLKNSTSTGLWKNTNMNAYLGYIQTIMVMIHQQSVFARNFYNYSVKRFYNDYWR